MELIGHDWPLTMRRNSPTTMRKAVNQALRTLAEEAPSITEARGMRGSGWEGDLDEMRRGRN